jgi:FkbM family methyltransferase
MADSDTLHQIQQRLRQLEGEVARLQASQTIYLGGHEALTRLHTGDRIYVDTRDVGICSHLMLDGRWEPWIESVVHEAVKPGMRFADVGANFGYYTLLGAGWVGPQGRVYSFEANPAIARKLRKSVSVNGYDDRVTLFQVAVFSEATTVDFAFTHEFSGGGAAGGADDGHWQTERLTVQALPLDRLLADVPAIDVMKIDVEGVEPQALQGAAGLLARSPQVTLVVEFHESSTAAMGGPLAYLSGFVQQGFSLALIEPSGLTLPLTPEKCLARLGGQLGYLHLSRGG